MTAPAGAIVGLYVDLIEAVEVGDIIETQSGRRYQVLIARVQQRGINAGRHHLRAVVLADSDSRPSAKVHRIRWYRRDRARAGIKRRDRR